MPRELDQFYHNSNWSIAPGPDGDIYIAECDECDAKITRLVKDNPDRVAFAKHAVENIGWRCVYQKTFCPECFKRR